MTLRAERRLSMDTPRSAAHLDLAALTRMPQPRALAPDATRAPLGAPSALETARRRRMHQAARVIAVVLASAIAVPSMARELAESDVGRASARVVQKWVSHRAVSSSNGSERERQSP